MDFMFIMSAMVRAIDYGPVLEDFLDVKLERNAGRISTVPSFLDDDPDFQMGNAQNFEPDNASFSVSVAPEDVEDDDDDNEVSIGLQKANTNYWDLPKEARALDALLYNVLKMNVKGGKRVLIECVTMASYVMSMIVLYRHADISRNDRITRAFDMMDSLSFDGDVSTWQVQAVKRIRELFSSGASIMHYALSRVMKSFNGKIKTIQYKIAEDINSRKITDETNVYDMIQTYASHVATVGDSKTAVNNVNVKTCRYCKKKGHDESDCRKKKNDKKNGNGKGNNGCRWLSVVVAKWQNE